MKEGSEAFFGFLWSIFPKREEEAGKQSECLSVPLQAKRGVEPDTSSWSGSPADPSQEATRGKLAPSVLRERRANEGPQREMI